LKSSKSEKVKEIVRHSCLQQKSPLRAGQPKLRNARTLTQNEARASANNSQQSAGGEDDSFLHPSIQIRKMPMGGQTPHAPAGRAITRRTELDFSFF